MVEAEFDFDGYEERMEHVKQNLNKEDELMISELQEEVEDLKTINKTLNDSLKDLVVALRDKGVDDNEEEEMLYVQNLDLRGEIDRLKGEIYDLSFKPMKKEITDLEDKIYHLENMTKEELIEKIQWYSDRTKPLHPNALAVDDNEEPSGRLEDEDEDEQQRRDEKNGLYAEKQDDAN